MLGLAVAPDVEGARALVTRDLPVVPEPDQRLEERVPHAQALVERVDQVVVAARRRGANPERRGVRVGRHGLAGDVDVVRRVMGRRLDLRGRGYRRSATGRLRGLSRLWLLLLFLEQ